MLMKWRATGKRDKPSTANKDVTGALMRVHDDVYNVRDKTWTQALHEYRSMALHELS